MLQLIDVDDDDRFLSIVMSVTKTSCVKDILELFLRKYSILKSKTLIIVL